MALKRYMDLCIHGDPANLRQFAENVETHLSDGWTRRREAELLMNELPNQSWFAFACSGDAQAGRRAATVYAVLERGTLRVTNIIPLDVHESLGYDNYNRILQEFHDLIRQDAQRQGFEIELSRDTYDLAESLTEETFRLLQAFSNQANRYALHPQDREQWERFLIRMHQEGWPIATEDLKRWLSESEGWPEYRALELAIEFENAHSLLRRFNEAA